MAQTDTFAQLPPGRGPFRPNHRQQYFSDDQFIDPPTRSLKKQQFKRSASVSKFNDVNQIEDLDGLEEQNVGHAFKDANFRAKCLSTLKPGWNAAPPQSAQPNPGYRSQAPFQAQGYRSQGPFEAQPLPFNATFAPNKRRASRDLSEEEAVSKKPSPTNQLSSVLGELNQTLSKYLCQKVSPIQTQSELPHTYPSANFYAGTDAPVPNLDQQITPLINVIQQQQQYLQEL